MIIGRGDISKAITDKEDFIFYASGNSNRKPLTQASEDKEHMEVYRLAQDYPKSNMFVYISTLSVYYSDSKYTKHKMRMEARVRKWFRNYAIIRIGNITWGDNPNTLINYLKNNKAEIQDTYRYLLDKDELSHWINMIPDKGQHEMNVTGIRTLVKDI